MLVSVYFNTTWNVSDKWMCDALTFCQVRTVRIFFVFTRKGKGFG